MLSNFSCFCHLLTFQNYLFKYTLSGTLSECQNGLDPDQDRQNFGPDLDTNCLQRLSADDKSGR